MQRRAAAVYVAFFLVVGAVSFSLIATASAPHFSVENPEHTLQQGESFTVDGTEYNVQSIEAEMSGGGGGGHGGGGGETLERSGALNWTNTSARQTLTWENGSTVTYDGQDWNVTVPTGQNESVTLSEVQNRQAILQNDSAVENQTTTVDGQEYVVRSANGNGSRELIPADEYFPAPEERTYSQGDEVPNVENNTATVDTVNSSGATLAWTAPQTNEVEVEDRANVTVGSTTYFAYFPDNETMVLTQQFDQYQAYQQESTDYKTHKDGLWGVTLLSGLISIFMIGLAYLPSRY
ncbi:hypothetical protein HUG10_11915 [Halorarum halophilum]|uniref:Uncharacterized protein n=1 Tax=Halorarum halophilum TaxID=2743090 RepID=A0A7D5K8I7_9EURY|nr:hypothetical protein [Halobaculum halophilum]QLG28214.1 hypothetical protein HUG10_11915 [Halobaculum halophilum]